MWEPLALKAGEKLIPFHAIKDVEIDAIESGVVVIVTQEGDRYIAHGFDAIEAVMILKPSALEGRRLKWKKGAWAFHNVVAHPVLQVLAWLGLKRLAIKLHDATVPAPRAFK
jgi:hypothetical protein